MVNLRTSGSMITLGIALGAMIGIQPSFAGQKIRARLDLSVLNAQDKPFLANELEDWVQSKSRPNYNLNQRKKRANTVCRNYGFEVSIDHQTFELNYQAIVKEYWGRFWFYKAVRQGELIENQNIYEYREYHFPGKLQVAQAEVDLTNSFQKNSQYEELVTLLPLPISEHFKPMMDRDRYRSSLKNTAFSEVICEGDLDRVVVRFTQDTYRVFEGFKQGIGSAGFFVDLKWALERPNERSFILRRVWRMMREQGISFYFI